MQFSDSGITFIAGVVVSIVMLITTILLTLVMIMIWRTPAILVALYFVVFFVMEGVYVSAVFTKFAEGDMGGRLGFCFVALCMLISQWHN